MLKNLTIKLRLIFVIALLSAVSLFVGISGFISLGTVNASLKTVYEDRLVSFGQLDQVVRLIDRNQFAIAKAITADPAQVGPEMDGVDQNIEEIAKVWGNYMATFLTPDEKKLADQFSVDRNKWRRTFCTARLRSYIRQSPPTSIP